MDVVRITELQPKTYVEQGDYIAIDNQNDGTKKVQFTNLLDNTLSQENKIAPANVVGDEITTIRDTVEDEIATIKAAVGSPLKASTVAQMTDKNKIYVYVGSESGYINGNWYYWNGSAWTSGGVYNSVAVVTDPTLTLSGVPADAKATGDEVTNLKSDIDSLIKYSNFRVLANNTHSATLDQLNISVSKGEVFYVIISGLNGRSAQAFAYTDSSNYSLGAISEGMHEFTATDNIVRIGLFVTSASTDADIHLGAFSNSDLLGKALGCQAYDIDAYSSHFNVASGSTHSTQIDQIFIDIASGEEFCIYVSGLGGRMGQVIAYNDDGNYTVGNLADGAIKVFTASQAIKRLGLFVTSGSSTVDISFIAFKSDSLVGKFSKMPDEYNALNVDAKSSHFSLSANSTHSEWSDEVPVAIKTGEKFCVLLNGLGDRVAQGYAHNNGVSISLGRIADGVITELTASQDISRIGLYITSSATATDISIIVFKSDSLLGKLHAIPVDEYNLQYEVKLANGKRKANAGGYNALTSPEIFTIAHFSDIHASGWAMKEIKKFREVFDNDLNDTICTGDMVHDEYSDGMGFWNDNSDGKILMCIGNHDSFNGTDWSSPISQATLYNTFIAPYKDNWGAETVTNHTYWYKDYPTQKIRLIAVDATIFNSSEQASQISWLNNALAGALSNGYAVVGAIHFPPMPATFQKIDSNFSALLHGTADDMDQFAWSTYSGQFLGAVDQFINNGGDFVCWLSGHTHHDILSYDTRYPRQLFVTITCAMPDANGEERERNINDGTGLVLNTVCVDTVRKYVKLIRYGAEWDDCLRHTGTCVVKYDSSPATVMFSN